MIRNASRLVPPRGPGRAARLLTVTLAVMTCGLTTAVLLLTMGTDKLTQEIGLCGVLTLGPMFGGTLAVGIVVALDYAAGDPREALTPNDRETAILPRIREDVKPDRRDAIPSRSRDEHHTTKVGSQRGSHRRAEADRS